VNRLIRIRLLVAMAILATVSALAVSATRPVAASISRSANVAVPTNEPLQVLPTITVVADIDAPTLMPLVIVRPSDSERRAALAIEVARSVSEAGGGSSDFVSDLLPRARLDMPYYSFGKMIPGASKD
jgi:hypothetical protein